MSWTAKIIKHNDDGLTMDVLFEREGYDPVPVGVLLPPAGVDLQEHLAKFAPIGKWAWDDEVRIARDRPAVGTVVCAPQPVAPAPTVAPVPLATINLEPVA